MAHMRWEPGAFLCVCDAHACVYIVQGLIWGVLIAVLQVEAGSLAEPRTHWSDLVPLASLPALRLPLPPEH